ncbi:hypothetical protein ACJW30_11G034000 [Castanea mollissima]
MKFLNAPATMSRVIRTIALNSRAPSVAFHIYGYAPIGARLRQDGVRIAVIIKPRMEMDGLNTKARWYMNVLKREWLVDVGQPQYNSRAEK